MIALLWVVKSSHQNWNLNFNQRVLYLSNLEGDKISEFNLSLMTIDA